MRAAADARLRQKTFLAVAIGTGLSLFGDTALYTVLPTHTAAAGVTLAAVGVLLSANRWIRIALNGPIGVAYARWSRSRLFTLFMVAAVISTASYAWTHGFLPLLLGRLLWGMAWSGIWIGGNVIILDLAGAKAQGRWIGRYQVAAFGGTLGGALLGGLLTDVVGYRQAMVVLTLFTLIGVGVVWLLLPPLARPDPLPDRDPTITEPIAVVRRPQGFVAALLLLSGDRLVIHGILIATIGLYIAERIGAVEVGGGSIGAATLAGLVLAANALMSMLFAPVIGRLLDNAGNRWYVAAAGLFCGAVGFILLVVSASALALIGVLLIAIVSSSNNIVATVVAGRGQEQGRYLGYMLTGADLASAVGPLLAFALIAKVGVNGPYLAAAAAFSALFLVAIYQGGVERTVDS